MWEALTFKVQTSSHSNRMPEEERDSNTGNTYKWLNWIDEEVRKDNNHGTALSIAKNCSDCHSTNRQRVAEVPVSHHRWQSAVLLLKVPTLKKKSTRNVPLLLSRSVPFWVSVRVADCSEKYIYKNYSSFFTQSTPHSSTQGKAAGVY